MWRILPQESELFKTKEEREVPEEHQEVPQEKFCQEPDMFLLWKERSH